MSGCPCTTQRKTTMANVKIPSFELNDGRDIPALGYGTWMGLDENFVFNTADIPKMKEALAYAIDIGYRHIDTAHLYRVEPEIGEVVGEKIKNGAVKREDLFITTKVWNHMHREGDVVESVRGSLRRLKLDYLDLVLVHWPMSVSKDGKDDKIDFLETWRGMEAVLAKGMAKSIGVSNFNVDQLKRLLANCKVPPATNQVEINLTLGQKELVDFCQQNKIVVVAYSPFGAMVPSRATAETPEPRIDNPSMVAIGKKYNKTVSQICLRYLFERGIVAIPKTITKTRVLENAQIFDFKLSKQDYETIEKFDINFRLVRPVFWEPFENYPFDKVTSKIPDIPLALREWRNGMNADID